MKKLTIREVLAGDDEFKGWLYLPSQPWTLDTEGFFYKVDRNLSPEDERQVRADFEAQGWKSTLSAEDIEDVVDNCEEQIDEPTPEQLLQSFLFYFENDAFKGWSDSE